MCDLGKNVTDLHCIIYKLKTLPGKSVTIKSGHKQGIDAQGRSYQKHYVDLETFSWARYRYPGGYTVCNKLALC